MEFSQPDIDRLRAGDRRTLSKMLTLLESSLESDYQAAQHLLSAILPYAGNSLRLGISGPPGVGKSTFIAALGEHLVGLGKRVAVLAVDPSSPVTGGSIMGDKTRMEALVRNHSAFIRPTPSLGAEGGVAVSTRESIFLLEAANYDVIIIETVGVGQSEVGVRDMVDCLVLLLQPNTGDELQGMKKGIMEVADVFIVNKDDGATKAAARKTLGFCRSAIKLNKQKLDCQPSILSCSALELKHIDEAWSVISTFEKESKERGEFEGRRARQSRSWIDKLLLSEIQKKLNASGNFENKRLELEREVSAGRLTSFEAARQLAALFYH